MKNGQMGNYKVAILEFRILVLEIWMTALY